MRAGIFLLLLTGCTNMPEITPGGVVSNNPCIDAVLEQIAAPGQVHAVSHYSHDPQSASASLSWARQFPAIGTGAEEVIAARPRLFLTGNLAAGGTNAAVQSAGIALKAFGVPATIAQSKAQISAIAKAIGREAAGRRLNQKIDAAVGAAAPSKTAPSALIWQSGGFVAGEGTLQDEMLLRTGFVNASKNYGLRQWSLLPMEIVIQNPPDVIFMPVDQRAGATDENAREQMLRKRLLRHFPRSRIVPFPDRLLFCGGPTIIEAMAAMRKAKA